MSDEIPISEATCLAIDLIAAEYKERGHDLTPEQVLAWAVKKLSHSVFFKPELSSPKTDRLDAGDEDAP